jgi:hypothetical protein
MVSFCEQDSNYGDYVRDAQPSKGKKLIYRSNLARAKLILRVPNTNSYGQAYLYGYFHPLGFIEKFNRYSHVAHDVY